MTIVDDAHTTLAAAPGVTALVADRISPVERKDYVYPAVVLTEADVEPLYSLQGWANLDRAVVQIDCWDTTYAGAKAVALACRAALEEAGFQMVSGVSDGFDSLAALGGLNRKTYQFFKWL